VKLSCSHKGHLAHGYDYVIFLIEWQVNIQGYNGMSESGKKSNVGRLMPQPAADDIISLKLLQLNLHQALAHSLKVQQILNDLEQKQGSDYIFGKGFIADSTTDMQEALSRVSFHLNAITKGQHIGLYMKLDGLKRKITALFDTASSDETVSSDSDLTRPDDDEVSMLLGRAVDNTARISIPDKDVLDTDLSECTTAHDLLVYCFKLLFDAVHSRLLVLTSVAHSALAAGETITMIPISYLGKDNKESREETASSALVSWSASHNEAAEMLTAGIDEVARSNLYGSRQARDNQDDQGRGVLLFSKDTVTLYHLSHRFRTVIAANVYEAVRGNYIYLLMAPCAHHQSSAFVNVMVEKLLYWLDFAAFRSHKTILAGIDNMTRSEMQNHLNMLGKMLSFVTAPKISPADEADVRCDIDVFLEEIV
jgi:hypothetical protein